MMDITRQLLLETESGVNKTNQQSLGVASGQAGCARFLTPRGCGICQTGVSRRVACGEGRGPETRVSEVNGDEWTGKRVSRRDGNENSGGSDGIDGEKWRDSSAWRAIAGVFADLHLGTTGCVFSTVNRGQRNPRYARVALPPLRYVASVPFRRSVPRRKPAKQPRNGKGTDGVAHRVSSAAQVAPSKEGPGPGANQSGVEGATGASEDPGTFGYAGGRGAG